MSSESALRSPDKLSVLVVDDHDVVIEVLIFACERDVEQLAQGRIPIEHPVDRVRVLANRIARGAYR